VGAKIKHPVQQRNGKSGCLPFKPPNPSYASPTWQVLCHFSLKSHRFELFTSKFDAMVTPHEISLFLGLLASGLFFWKYKQYETQLRKEEMLDSFLDQHTT
jgi:hypothetical protein